MNAERRERIERTLALMRWYTVKHAPRIHVRMEREQVEVTRSGMFTPFKADPARVFIPGMTTYFVTVDDEPLPPMSPEQYDEWRRANDHWIRRADAELAGSPR